MIGANLDETAAHEILDSPANSNAADFESLNEAIFGRQLTSNLEVAIVDLAGEDCLDV
jgi:hypothetical protein